MLCSVVVPTYKEKLNLRPLITRTFAALEPTRLKGRVELIVVDDNSADGSQEEVETLAREGFPCRIVVRTKGETRTRGSVFSSPPSQSAACPRL